MKTLKTLERERLSLENDKIKNLLKSYNRTDISETTKKEIAKRISESKKAIGNLPDLIRQEIARNANLLFEGIRDALTQDDFRSLYYGDFEEFIEKVASLEETASGYERISNVAYNMDVQKAILYFGISREELEELFKKGLCDKYRDIFMAFINKKYNTSIPMSKDLVEKTVDPDADMVTLAQNRYDIKKIKLHNGEYMTGEYPTYYESQVDTYFKEIIKEYKSIQRRTKRI